MSNVSGPLLHIKELGTELRIGEQKSGQMCPFCGGGMEQEASFSIKREYDNVLYMCHRNKCSASGAIPLNGTGNELDNDDIRVLSKKKKASAGAIVTLTSPTLHTLTDQQRKHLADKYGLTLKEIVRAGWLADRYNNRLVMPIRNSMHVQIGTESKAFDENKNPKTITRITDPKQLMMAWKIPFPLSSRYVVVEDQISMVKVSRVENCVALLGTNFNDVHAQALLEHGVQDVIMCLDKDATATSLEYAKAYGELFKSFVVVEPRADPKYLSDTELKNLFFFEDGNEKPPIVIEDD